MIVLAQYGKGAIREQKDDEPQLHHIEGTDALSHDSHRVFMLHPHKLTIPEGQPYPLLVPYTLFIRKARKGGAGRVDMIFDRQHTRFIEVVESREPVQRSYFDKEREEVEIV